jgi:hypothetical protein
MNQILTKYVGEDIGINFKEAKKYDEAELVEVNVDYFSIRDPETNLLYSYPVRAILNIVEGDGGVSAGGVFSRKEYAVCVEVWHMVVYSGAAGIGVSF